MIRLPATVLLAVSLAGSLVAVPTASAVPAVPPPDCTSDQVPLAGQCIARSPAGRPGPQNPLFALFPGANPNLPPGLTPTNLPVVLPLGLTPRNVPTVLPLGLTPQTFPAG